MVSPSVPNEKTQSKKPPKKPRKVKKTPENRVFLELLPRFELGTSSLPTALEDEILWFCAVSGAFCSVKVRIFILFIPSVPPQFFRWWVCVWVRGSVRRFTDWVDPFKFQRSLRCKRRTEYRLRFFRIIAYVFLK